LTASINRQGFFQTPEFIPHPNAQIKMRTIPQQMRNAPLIILNVVHDVVPARRGTYAGLTLF
jgi:hypothetical protein